MPLNKGRGSNPGDTRRSALGQVGPLVDAVAQQRPGFEPRRHSSTDTVTWAVQSAYRSTKAGVRTPATPAVGPSNAEATLNSHAQQRPGFEPRRHLEAATQNATVEHAQQRPGFEPRRHYRERGTATVAVRAQQRPGFEPRRHSYQVRAGTARSIAQQRPGFEPRRHITWDGTYYRVVDRSTKAGVRTPATQQPHGPVPRTPARSTKAGVRTPATLLPIHQ